MTFLANYLTINKLSESYIDFCLRNVFLLLFSLLSFSDLRIHNSVWTIALHFSLIAFWDFNWKHVTVTQSIHRNILIPLGTDKGKIDARETHWMISLFFIFYWNHCEIQVLQSWLSDIQWQCLLNDSWRNVHIITALKFENSEDINSSINCSYTLSICRNIRLASVKTLMS